MDYFARCQQIVAVSEGGANFNVINGKPVLKSSARPDRGGPTKYGITWGTLSKAYSQGIVDHSDIVKLTKDEANAIYEANYWRPSRADKIPWALCLAHYDCAVNCGVGGAAKQLQRALRNLGENVAIDGIIGPASLRAISELDIGRLTNEYLDVRAAFYNGIVAKNASQGAFLNGWLNRLERIRAEVNR